MKIYENHYLKDQKNKNQFIKIRKLGKILEYKKMRKNKVIKKNRGLRFKIKRDH